MMRAQRFPMYDHTRSRSHAREPILLDGPMGSELVRRGIGEARVALEAAKALGLPCWVAFVPGERGRLFTGETLSQAVAQLEPLGVDAILLNCAPPADITTGLEELAPRARVPIGAYAHVGRFDPPEWLFTDEFPPREYREAAARWKRMGTRILGGCCGTTPEHIAALATLR